jgi:hypothetical protein
MWKRPRGGHHQTLCHHFRNDLRDEVHAKGRLSHRSLSFLLQQESPQFGNFVPHRGLFGIGFLQTYSLFLCLSHLRSEASSTVRISGFILTIPANVVGEGGSDLSRLASSMSSLSSLL